MFIHSLVSGIKAPSCFSKKIAALMMAALLFTLSACGIGTQNPNNAASSQTIVSEEQSSAALAELAQQLKDGKAAHPKEVTGPSSAKNTPEVQAMVDTPTPQLPVTFKDYTGKEVTVKSAERILALDTYGTLAQDVIALGLGGRLVGRTVSNTEQSLSKLPVMTQNGHDLNVEAILSAKPDVVFLDSSASSRDAAQKLESSGITVVLTDTNRKMNLIIPQLKLVAQALGVQEAGNTVAERIQKDLDYATTTLKEVAPQGDQRLSMAFLYVRGNSGVFFVLGDGYGTDELITAVGGRGVAAENGIKEMTMANAEALVKLNPDLILVMSRGLKSTGGVDGLVSRPGVEQTTAGKNRRIVDMDDGQILSFGPNTPAVLLSLAKAIYAPEGQ